MRIPNSPFHFSPNFDAILNVCDARQAWECFLAFNSSGQLPYHNSTHTRFAVEDAFMLGYRRGGISSWRDLTKLVLASIAHDYNHSGGRTSDAENIQQAIHAVKQFAKPSLSELTPDDEAQIVEAVACTEYDLEKGFVMEPTTPIAMALRDADLCTMFHVWQEEGLTQVHGLFLEINDRRNLHAEEKVTWGGFLLQQAQFLTAAKFYTPTGVELQQKYLTNALGYAVQCNPPEGEQSFNSSELTEFYSVLTNFDKLHILENTNA